MLTKFGYQLIIIYSVRGGSYYSIIDYQPVTIYPTKWISLGNHLVTTDNLVTSVPLDIIVTNLYHVEFQMVANW